MKKKQIIPKTYVPRKKILKIIKKNHVFPDELEARSSIDINFHFPYLILRGDFKNNVLINPPQNIHGDIVFFGNAECVWFGSSSAVCFNGMIHILGNVHALYIHQGYFRKIVISGNVKNIYINGGTVEELHLGLSEKLEQLRIHPKSVITASSNDPDINEVLVSSICGAEISLLTLRLKRERQIMDIIKKSGIRQSIENQE